MLTTKIGVMVGLGLAALLSLPGDCNCTCLPPLFGEINDEYMEDLYPQIVQCCCYNNQVTDLVYWDDPESNGAQGSCSCPGWEANNCKTKRRYRFLITEATVTEDEKNYHDYPGHWAGQFIVTQSYWLRCWCWDTSTQTGEDCEIASNEVPLKYTKIYFCEDC